MASRMSDRRRVLQWATFARTWWVYDAYGQCPFKTAHILTSYLQGQHKPIYHPLSDCGDHVVVVNTHYIAMPDRFWRTWRHFHHTGYAGGFVSRRAWQVHRKDATEVLRRQIYTTLPGNLLRNGLMARLHLYPFEKDVPQNVMNNITNQIRQGTYVPKRLEDYSQEEKDEFPKLYEWNEDADVLEGKSYTRLKPYLTNEN